MIPFAEGEKKEGQTEQEIGRYTHGLDWVDIGGRTSAVLKSCYGMEELLGV